MKEISVSKNEELISLIINNSERIFKEKHKDKDISLSLCVLCGFEFFNALQKELNNTYIDVYKVIKPDIQITPNVYNNQPITISLFPFVTLTFQHVNYFDIPELSHNNELSKTGLILIGSTPIFKLQIRDEKN